MYQKKVLHLKIALELRRLFEADVKLRDYEVWPRYLKLIPLTKKEPRQQTTTFHSLALQPQLEILCQRRTNGRYKLYGGITS